MWPQGVAGALAFNSTAELDENVESMRLALEEVYCLEITRAVRETSVEGLKVKEGDSIGILDGELAAACSEPEEVVRELARRLDGLGVSLATVYYGEGVGEEERGRLVGALEKAVPSLEVEVLEGGQPHYEFIVSLE